MTKKKDTAKKGKRKATKSRQAKGFEDAVNNREPRNHDPEYAHGYETGKNLTERMRKD